MFLDSLDLSGGVSRAAAAVTGTLATGGRRYDKLPLVPNMEEEEHEAEVRRQTAPIDGPFSLG